MAKNTSNAAQFAEEDDVPEVELAESAVVVNDDMVNARVKGTWMLYYGGQKYDFKDGNRYRISRDLFQYLKKHGNIYDTMA